MPIIETKFDVFYILTFSQYNVVMDDWNWMKNHLISDNLCNTANLECPIFFQQETTMLNLHLMLVTLHMQFNISIEQDK